MNLKLKFAFIIIAVNVLQFNVLNAQTKEGTESITLDELKNHMYFLASDYLGGRVSYEPGYDIAAEYCASQFKSIGLETVLKDKSGQPTYFQNVPLIKKTLGKDYKISLVGTQDETPLEQVTDYKIPDQVRSVPNPELEMVFVGYGIEEPKYKWNDFAKTDITGKAVVMLMGAPKRNGKPVLPDSIDKKYQSVQGINAKFGKILEKKPAVCLILLDNEILSKFPWEMLPHFAGGEQYAYADKSKMDEGFLIPILLAVKPEASKKLFKGQQYSPDQIEKDGLKGYKSFQFSNLKFKSNFSISESDTIFVKNVVGKITGSDPVLNKEFVTVGAHLDHVPKRGQQICNGADDNASGSVGVIELAEAMMLQKPLRSVIFSLYAAEELGLIGSMHLVNNCPVTLEQIVANLNLDMIGRSSEKNLATKALYVESHPEYLESMTKLIGDVNTQTVNWPLIFENCEGSMGDSDHSSFHAKGIPNVHFFSGVHKDLHAPTDDAEKIDYEKMQKITQLVYYLTYKLANMEKLPFAQK